MKKILTPFTVVQQKHIRIAPKGRKEEAEPIDGKAAFTLDQASQDNGVTLQDDEDGLGTTIIPKKGVSKPGAFTVSIEADADLSANTKLLFSSAEGELIAEEAQVVDVIEEDAVDQPE